MALLSNRRRNMGGYKFKDPLPKEYRYMSWIETQAEEKPFSTGVSLKNVGKIELQAAVFKGWGNDKWLMGAKAGSTQTGIKTSNSSLQAYLTWNGTSLGGKVYGHQMMIYRMSITGENTITYKVGQFEGTFTSSGAAAANPDADIKLMCNKYMTGTSATTGFKIFALKLYGRKSDGTASDELVADMVPAKRVSDNKVGMYDFARQQFDYTEGKTYYGRPALYKGDTFSSKLTDANLSYGPWLDRIGNNNQVWTLHTVDNNKYYNQSGTGGMSTNVYYLTSPGKVVFTNPTQRYSLMFMLLDKNGVRKYATTVSAGKSVSWSVSKKMWKEAPYIGFVWTGTSDEATVKAIDWSFMYI